MGRDKLPSKKQIQKQVQAADASQNQAQLLRGRGDFQGTKHCWNVDLTEEQPLHLRESLIKRLGRSLKKGAVTIGHSVRGVADDYLRCKPGDKIRSLNRSETADEMMSELNQASSISISLERVSADVLEVAPARPLSASSRCSSSCSVLPALLSNSASEASLLSVARPAQGVRWADTQPGAPLERPDLRRSPSMERPDFRRSPSLRQGAALRDTASQILACEKPRSPTVSEASTRLPTPCAPKLPEPPLPLGQQVCLPGCVEVPASPAPVMFGRSLSGAKKLRRSSSTGPMARWGSK